MKILLVLPAADHSRLTSPNSPPPKEKMLRFSVLSAMTVAGLTPPEHEVAFCDENVQCLDPDQTPDVVGISFMTGLAPRAYEISEHFRKKGIITVAGGYHPTLCPDDARRHFDIVVVGQAEGVWPKVLQDIQANAYQPVYTSDANIEQTDYPPPRRDIIHRNRQHYVTAHAIQTGRGCAHRCQFCSIAAFFNGRQYSRPLDQVMTEIRSAPRRFIFIDDNIIANREYAVKLFTAMRPLKKRWACQCSIEIANDPKLLDLAWQAGCRGLFIGIESVNDANLADVDKTFNEARLLSERIKRIHRRGIAILAAMIVGFEHDDETVFERHLAFLQKHHIESLQLSIMTPLPGTPLHEKYKKDGRLVESDWAKYDFQHVVFEPKEMTRQQLKEGADWLYRQYYRLDRILMRAFRSFLSVGFITAVLSLRLGLTYRRRIKRRSSFEKKSTVDQPQVEQEIMHIRTSTA